MFIYESHLGGLYASEEELDYDMLYCETCGDADMLLGCVDDNDIAAAWELLRPGDLACIECAKPFAADDSCDSCTETEESFGMGYGLKGVLEFLRDNFAEERRHYAYLFLETEDGEVYVRDAGIKDHFFEAQNVPSCYCYKAELARKAALSLLPHITHDPRQLEELGTAENGKGIHHVFRYPLDTNADYHFDLPEPNASSWDGEAWAALRKKEDITFGKSQEFLKDLIIARDSGR